MNYVQLTKDDSVGTITLQRLDVMNALDDQMMTEIQTAYTTLASDDQIRVIIFKSAGGRAFVAGADINSLNKAPMLSGLSSGIQEFFSVVEESPKVTISVVDGYALGGGCELAMACDIRIATTNAQFALPELSLGILPGAGGTQRLARIIGKGRALNMILTGKYVDGKEAYAIGLASYLTTPDELEDTVNKVVTSILRNAPIATTLAKLAVHNGYDLDMKTAQLIEKLTNTILFGTEDKNEGTAAFIEKRTPHFQNK